MLSLFYPSGMKLSPIMLNAEYLNGSYWHTADVDICKCLRSDFAGDCQVIYKRSSSKMRTCSQVTCSYAELAERYPRYGFKKLFQVIRRQGHVWNHKRVHRIYCLLKLNFRRKGKQRLPVRNPARLAMPEAINQSWSVDFMHDALVSGRRFRTFNVVDDFNREALAIETDLNIPAQRVIRVLDRIVAHRGYPLKLRMDNGLPSESTILHAGILPSNTKTIVHFNIRYCPHFLSAYKYAYHDIQD